MALTVHHSSRPNRLAAIDTVNNMLIANSRADVVLAPVQGPSNPFKFNATVPGASRVGLGTVETADMEDWCFNDQYQTYQKSGYAIDVDSKAVVGDFNEFIRNKGNSASYTKKITGRCSLRTRCVP
jgi:pre-mRNA-processing factor 17